MTAAAVIVDPVALERLAAPGGVVDRYLARIAAEVATRAADGAPHRSGRLAASIHVEGPTSPPGWAVVASTPYARIIEARTPYLVPALAEVVR